MTIRKTRKTRRTKKGVKIFKTTICMTLLGRKINLNGQIIIFRSMRKW